MNHTYRIASWSTIRTSAATVLLAASLAVLLAGCADDSTAIPQEVDIPFAPQVAGAIDTPEELRGLLDDSGAGEKWLDALNGIVFTTKLGSPVIELHFSADTETVRDFAEAAFSALHAQETGLDAWVEAWSKEGQVAGTGLGTPRQRDLPPPPGDVDGLLAWLDEVYGPDRDEPVEPWYDAIETIEIGTSGAGEPAVVVHTTLVADDVVSAGQADLIALAISDSGLDFAVDIDIWYADGAGLLSAGVSDFNPYVY